MLHYVKLNVTSSVYLNLSQRLKCTILGHASYALFDPTKNLIPLA